MTTPSAVDGPSPSGEGLAASGAALDPTARRVAAYVRLLPVDAAERLALAQRLGAAGGTLPAAMASARAAAAPALERFAAEPEKSPGVLRGHMTPEHMDRRPYIFWLDRKTAPLRRVSTIYTNTRLLYFVQTVLAFAFAWFSGRIGGRP